MAARSAQPSTWGPIRTPPASSTTTWGMRGPGSRATSTGASAATAAATSSVSSPLARSMRGLRPPSRGRAWHGGYWLRSRTVSGLGDVGMAGARAEAGRALRRTVPRSSHATWDPAPRRSPLALVEESDRRRLPELVPIRHARMAASPFAFLRETPAVMAHDLATTPVTGITVQACGDAHLLNFGLFATPERNLSFGLNDFDETLPAPWEWDVKRLATSFVVAARTAGFDQAVGRRAAQAAVRTYRNQLARYAGMRLLDVWYSRVDASTIIALSRGRRRRAVADRLAKAEHHTNLDALPR